MYNFYLCLLFLALLFNNCRKINKIYDNKSDKIGAISIMELKRMYHKSGTFLKIDEDLQISGTVVGNDKDGNLYRTIIIQDSSGGIAVNIDGYNLYTNYPIGQKVKIKCKYLTLNDYGHSISLGLDKDIESNNPQLIAIPSTVAGKYIQKDGLVEKVEPKLVKLGQLTTELHNRYQNTLIKLENLEAKNQKDIGKPLADPSKLISARSYTLVNCKKQTIVLRTSSYSSFASAPLPGGNGTVVGIFTPYKVGRNDEKNLTILKLEDLDLKGPKCTFKSERVKIIDVRKYTQDDVFPAGWYIDAVVISDTKNEIEQNYVLQDESGGIAIRFAHKNEIPKDWKPNTKVRLNLELLQLSTYKGFLQISRIPKKNVENKQEEIKIETKQEKISDLHKKINTDQSLPYTLVSLAKPKIQKKNNTSTGQKLECYIITDSSETGDGQELATGNSKQIETCVRSSELKKALECYANGNSTNNQELDSIKGYVSTFNGKLQITLRNCSDLVCNKQPPNSKKCPPCQESKRKKK